MKRSPQQAAVQQSSRVSLPQVNLSFAVPQLPGYQQTIVKIFSE
jgi:hypothetical protein